MLPKDKYLKIYERILGKKFKCGFYSANALKPGARGQLFHIDHPYPTIEVKKATSDKFSYKKPLNMQSLLFLTDINDDNGPTSFVPYSQLLQLNPSYLKIKIDEENKRVYCKQRNKKFLMEYIDFKGKAGTMVIFNGLAWHRGGYNYSFDKNRIALLGQWIPNFIIPMHQFTIKKNKIKQKVLQLISGNEFPAIV